MKKFIIALTLAMVIILTNCPNANARGSSSSSMSTFPRGGTSGHTSASDSPLNIISRKEAKKIKEIINENGGYSVFFNTESNGVKIRFYLPCQDANNDNYIQVLFTIALDGSLYRVEIKGLKDCDEVYVYIDKETWEYYIKKRYRWTEKWSYSASPTPQTKTIEKIVQEVINYLKLEDGF